MSLPLPAAVRPNVVTASALPRLLLHRAGSPRRHEIEGFISAVCRERFGADLQHFWRAKASNGWSAR